MLQHPAAVRAAFERAPPRCCATLRAVGPEYWDRPGALGDWTVRELDRPHAACVHHDRGLPGGAAHHRPRARRRGRVLPDRARRRRRAPGCRRPRTPGGPAAHRPGRRGGDHRRPGARAGGVHRRRRAGEHRSPARSPSSSTWPPGSSSWVCTRSTCNAPPGSCPSCTPTPRRSCCRVLTAARRRRYRSSSRSPGEHRWPPATTCSAERGHDVRRPPSTRHRRRCGPPRHRPVHRARRAELRRATSPTSAPTSSRSSGPTAATACATWPGATPATATGLWWKLVNRNKRTVALDLKDADDLDVFRRLVADADVLVENFRPGTLERLGLGPDVLLAAQPAAGDHPRHRLRPDRARTRAGPASPPSPRACRAWRRSAASPTASRCCRRSRSPTRSPAWSPRSPRWSRCTAAWARWSTSACWRACSR